MIITIASGKGGTGKTTVAASFAYSIDNSVYFDCDVEEPNGHLLLQPEMISEEITNKLIPVIDAKSCTVCGKCSEVCEFNALINLQTEIMLVEDMCHSCGACSYFCPEKAINEVKKVNGIVRKGLYNTEKEFVQGVLNVGELSGVPLINKVKENIEPGKINILDAPPGTSCAMVEAVMDSDYCVLVTESSPFGLSDLKLAVDVVRKIGAKFGVIVNKYDPEFSNLEEYLNEENISLLLKIPFDKEIAQGYSKGILPVVTNHTLKEEFDMVYETISQLVAEEEK